MVTDRPPRRRVLLGEFLKSEKLQSNRTSCKRAVQRAGVVD